MPIFKPFRGIRPQEAYLRDFPSESIDKFSLDELLEKAQNKDSYIHMLKPYLLSKSKDTDRNLRKTRKNFEEILEEKKLVQDDICYYLYQQTSSDNSIYRGLLGLVNINDFLEGKIKKHESTLKLRKERLAYYLSKVHLQSEPVLLTYPTNSKIELFMNQEEKNVPVINFTSENGTRHRIWKIDNRLKIKQIKEELGRIETFYVGDGHHRLDACVSYGKNQAKKYKKTGTEPYNFVYSFIVSRDSVRIHDYNRLLKNIHPMDASSFLKKIEAYFLVHEKGETPYFPSQKFHMSLYMERKFYSLHVKHELRKKHAENNDLDHFFLEKYLFGNILQIEKESESNNVDYIKGTSSLEGILQMKQKVDSGIYKAGIGIHPVSFHDLTKVCDRNMIMPPKCTLMEPKPMTALVIYDTKQP
ncbi:MAG: DUF1015 domain-containing protein [Bergeyella sp.]|nr:DUF1015 domain-containing protein [Bergeyella sp.]